MKWIALFMLSACACFGQTGLRSPAFVANLHPAPSGGCATPNAPTNLLIDYGGDPPNFDIAWTAPTGSLDGQELWRSEDGAGFILIFGGLGPSTGGVTPDDALNAESAIPAVGDGHVYIYKARATNACGTQSPFSNTVTNDIFFDAVSYYRMEEAAGNSRTATIDSAGFGSLTEQDGTVSQNAGGINNNCAAFTSIAGHSLKSTNQKGVGILNVNFSIGVWIYVTALPIAVNNDLITREVNDDCHLDLDTSGTLNWVPDPTASAVSATLGSLNTWHYAVVVANWDSGDTSISVDGSIFTTQAGGVGSFPDGDDFLYVVPPFGGLVVLNGRIDELCIWPRVLSQAEVTSLYGGGTAPRFK